MTTIRHKDKCQATCSTELTKYGFIQSLWCTVKVKTGKLSDNDKTGPIKWKCEQ